MEDITKICYRCQVPKLLTEFNKCKRGTFGVHGHCRACQKEVRRLFYEQKQKPTKYWLTPECREYNRIQSKEKYHNDPTWREKTKLKNNTRRRMESAKIKAREQRKRWLQIPHNRIAHSLRGRLRKALKHGIKISTTETLLGCSFEHVKSYLESKFQPEMTWENYGRWHIDHIIPCSFFDLTDSNQQKMCFNYRNLQPMWKLDNISKCNRFSIDETIPLLKELCNIT